MNKELLGGVNVTPSSWGGSVNGYKSTWGIYSAEQIKQSCQLNKNIEEMLAQLNDCSRVAECISTDPATQAVIELLVENWLLQPVGDLAQTRFCELAQDCIGPILEDYAYDDANNQINLNIAAHFDDSNGFVTITGQGTATDNFVITPWANFCTEIDNCLTTNGLPAWVDLFTLDGTVIPTGAIVTTSNILELTGNTLTSEVNGITDTADVITSIGSTLDANGDIIITVNWVATTPLDLQLDDADICAYLNSLVDAWTVTPTTKVVFGDCTVGTVEDILANTTNVFTTAGNIATSTVNGVTETAPIVNTVTTSIDWNNDIIISVNWVPSLALDISTIIAAEETDTTFDTITPTLVGTVLNVQAQYTGEDWVQQTVTWNVDLAALLNTATFQSNDDQVLSADVNSVMDLVFTPVTTTDPDSQVNRVDYTVSATIKPTFICSGNSISATNQVLTSDSLDINTTLPTTVVVTPDTTTTPYTRAVKVNTGCNEDIYVPVTQTLKCWLVPLLPTDQVHVVGDTAFLDEDGRTIDSTCDWVALHRTLHVDNVHTGSVTTPWGLNLLVSNMDSNQASVNNVTTIHTRTVLSATNWTSSWLNSVVLWGINNIASWERAIALWWNWNQATSFWSVAWGFQNIYSGNYGFVTWFRNTVSGSANIVGGWAWAGLDSHIVTGNSNWVFWHKNTGAWNFSVFWGQENIDWIWWGRNLLWGIWNDMASLDSAVWWQNNVVRQNYQAVFGRNHDLIGANVANLVSGTGHTMASLESFATGFQHTISGSRNIAGGQNGVITGSTSDNIIVGNGITIISSASAAGDNAAFGQNITVTSDYTLTSGSTLTNDHVYSQVFGFGIGSVREQQTHMDNVWINIAWNGRTYVNDAAAWTAWLLQWEVYSDNLWFLRIKL